MYATGRINENISLTPSPPAPPCAFFHKKLYNNEARSKLDLPPKEFSSLPLAQDVAVRMGALDHFDLRVNADSVTGKAIAKEFGLRRLSDSEGASERLKLIMSERDSQRGVRI